MLPSSLKGIYQQCKADTDVVAEWLAVTATEHGYRSANSFSASNPAVKGGRLKGKARKQAKATVSGHTAAATTPDAASGTTQIVKTNDFEPMAVYIAGCSDIIIPQYFAKALGRSISVRKNFAERLGSNGVNIRAESENWSFQPMPSCRSSWSEPPRKAAALLPASMKCFSAKIRYLQAVKHCWNVKSAVRNRATLS